MGTGRPKQFREKGTFKEPIKENFFLNGPSFYGELLKGSLLSKNEQEKEQKSFFKAIPKELQKLEEENGWGFDKQLKNGIRICKDKKIDELLEDEIWVLFKQLGFLEMNKDRNFRIRFGEGEGEIKQVDIFAKDENHAFIIFCTTKEKEGKSKRLKDLINETIVLKRGLEDSVKKQYKKGLRVSFLIVTRGMVYDEGDEKLARDNGIFFWKDSDIEEFRNIVNQIGIAAKYQIYSLLFGDKPSSEVEEIKVPAMKGGVGDEKYYCFLIQPEKLFKIAYVHRKEKSSPKEIGSSYQRMVNKQRIENIGRFINKGNHFPNNIIISFIKGKEPIFEPLRKEDQEGDIVYGTLKFPRHYGCAWVIDGQHRLYGYTKSEHASDHTIPVIAYKSLSVKDQANLFVDINKQQQPVNKNLLWDLYPDIYEGSTDPEHQILRVISLIGKKLNEDKDSKFYGRIQIPSIITKDPKTINLTLTNICDIIKETKLINKPSSKTELLLYNEDYERTVNFAAKRINAYFDIISEFIPDDWERGDYGLLRTNIGVRIFFLIFRQLLLYLNHLGKREVYTKGNLEEFKKEVSTLLGLIKKNLGEKSKDQIREIRVASNKGQVMINTERLLWETKEKIGLGKELWIKGKYRWSPSIPKEEDSEERIKELVKETESLSKKFLVDKLIKIYGEEKWYMEGLPEGTRQTIQKKIAQEISRFPPKKSKIDSYSEEKKFIIYSSTSDLKEIIKQNGKKLSDIFGDIEYSSSQFKSLELLRNAYIGHEEDERKEEIDEIERKLGYWGTKWIRRCIGLDPGEGKVC